jgi:hypothetical protein
MLPENVISYNGLMIRILIDSGEDILIFFVITPCGVKISRYICNRKNEVLWRNGKQVLEDIL